MAAPPRACTAGVRNNAAVTVVSSGRLGAVGKHW
jgi:hypothetical protein